MDWAFSPDELTVYHYLQDALVSWMHSGVILWVIPRQQHGFRFISFAYFVSTSYDVCQEIAIAFGGDGNAHLGIAEILFTISVIGSAITYLVIHERKERERFEGWT